MARPIAEDYGDKRRAILKAAARHFADEGYGRASMSGLARACGISKANIYHYYSGKEAILFDMLESHLRDLRDRVCNLEYPSDDPGEQLRLIFTEILLAYEGADAEHDVLLSAIQALPPEQQEVLRDYQREFIKVGRARLAALCPREIIEDKGTLWAITMSVFGMLNWHYKWCSNADEETRRAHAKLMADLVIRGLPDLAAKTLHETSLNG